MKKIIFMTMSLLMVSSLVFGVEENQNTPQNEAPVVQETSETPENLSKSESFMTAFGMRNSNLLVRRRVRITVAHTNTHSTAVNLTHPQNTPYTYGNR
ncbi:hypothetical protein HS141_05755 [Cetobacterium somerae]|uniref:hypothetical protein n=1 Tax=Cetobacterium somerae TaxID=188913 RepID=UPI00211E5068|nr:hypothetical protein [Cetobacterium somerae]MCQ9626475.1 hypothetical protein [Cetobacterium somerae]